MIVTLPRFGEIELVNFVELSLEDKSLILSIRNHPEIKVWMYNQVDIDIDSHLNFIKSLESDVTKKYFALKQDSHIIGSVNFTEIDLYKNQAEFGFYANPFVAIPGTGRILEEVSIFYGFDQLGVSKLMLEVFEENSKVINLHKKYGFKITRTKQNQGKPVCCMALIKK